MSRHVIPEEALSELEQNSVEMQPTLDGIQDWNLLKKKIETATQLYSDARKEKDPTADDDGTRRAKNILKIMQTKKPNYENLLAILFAVFQPIRSNFGLFKRLFSSPSSELAKAIANEFIEGEFSSLLKYKIMPTCNGYAPRAEKSTLVKTLATNLSSKVFSTAQLDNSKMQIDLFSDYRQDEEHIIRRYDKTKGVRQMLLAIRNTMSPDQKKSLDERVNHYQLTLIVSVAAQKDRDEMLGVIAGLTGCI